MKKKTGSWDSKRNFPKLQSRKTDPNADIRITDDPVYTPIMYSEQKFNPVILRPGNPTMHVLETDCALFCDVDETLVLFNYPPELEDQTVEIRPFHVAERVLINHRHIKALREFKARGHAVIVWSAGGARWAAAVVKALGIEPYVDLVMSKPHWLIDDKPVEKWIGERFYLDAITGAEISSRVPEVLTKKKK